MLARRAVVLLDERAADQYSTEYYKLKSPCFIYHILTFTSGFNLEIMEFIYPMHM